MYIYIYIYVDTNLHEFPSKQPYLGTCRSTVETPTAHFNTDPLRRFGVQDHGLGFGRFGVLGFRVLGFKVWGVRRASEYKRRGLRRAEPSKCKHEFATKGQELGGRFVTLRAPLDLHPKLPEILNSQTLNPLQK